MKAMGWVLGCWMLVGAAFAENLSLENYLGQVKSRGPAFRAAQAAVESYEKQSHQQDLIYSPILNVGYGHMDDQQQQIIPFNGTRTQADAAGVTLTEKFPFGPSLSLGYGFNNITLTDSPFITAPYYTVAPAVSLSVPL